MFISHDQLTYVDNTAALYYVSSDAKDATVQQTIITSIEWSLFNEMHLNVSKAKELLIFFTKTESEVSHVSINGTDVTCVESCTLLRLEFCNNLSCLVFIGKLTQAKLPVSDIVSVYVYVMRPVLVYACHVWHPGLTDDQHEATERLHLSITHSKSKTVEHRNNE